VARVEIVQPEPFKEAVFLAKNKSDTMKAKETKKKPAPEPEKLEDSRKYKIGKMAALGIYDSPSLIQAFGQSVYGEFELEGALNGLKPLNDEVKKGDFKRLEIMLADQAVSLNTIFTAFARRAWNAGSIPQLEINMRMALKAQNQCRATIDTLAQIKNPRQTVITKQANISNGPQQVNNTLNQVSEPEGKISENSETSQNELLSHEQAENPYMDTGTASKASGDNPPMATVETIHRAAH